MRYIYYCNSAYQLLNVLNLNWHRKYAGFENIDNYEADLVLLNAFDGAKEIIDILENDKTFNRAILINKKFNKGRFHSVLTLMDAISPSFYMNNKYSKELTDIKNRYDVVCFPKFSTVVSQIWNLNPAAQLELYEEGLGTYHLDIPFVSNSRLYRRISEIKHNGSFYDYQRLYVINKDFYMADHIERVIEIPKFNKEYLYELKDKMSVFNKLADRDFHIFWLSQFLNNVEYNIMVDEMLQELIPYKDDVLFVQHPRKYVDNKYGFEEANKKQIWEMQLLGMNDVDNKLFVSIHSTACFSAKMLFDQEPYILLFYKLGDYEVAHITDEFEAIVDKFAKSYRDPDKIMIPATKQEFIDCLKRYHNEVLDK